jgi:hypothetical protein
MKNIFLLAYALCFSINVFSQQISEIKTEGKSFVEGNTVKFEINFSGQGRCGAQINFGDGSTSDIRVEDSTKPTVITKSYPAKGSYKIEANGKALIRGLNSFVPCKGGAVTQIAVGIVENNTSASNASLSTPIGGSQNAQVSSLPSPQIIQGASQEDVIKKKLPDFVNQLANKVTADSPEGRAQLARSQEAQEVRDIEAKRQAEMRSDNTQRQQPRQPNAQTNQTSAATSPNNICEKMKNSTYLVEYANIAENVYKSNFWTNQFGTFAYDTQDKLVSKWLLTKINSMKRENSMRYSQVEREWEGQIKKCTEEFASTNLFPLFVNSRSEYNRILREITAKPSRTNSVREVDSSGNIVTKEVKTGGYTAENVRILDSSGRSLNEATIPALLTILDPDNKFISNIHPEIKKEWAPILVSIDSSKKRDAEFEQKQAIAEKEKAIALQKEKDIELKKQQDDKVRLEKIRNGDFKLANNCLDIIKVLGDKIDDNDGAAIKPHQGLKATAGTLARFGGDAGIILTQSRSGTTGAEFKTSSSTNWINKNDIRLNSGVFVIGKYTSNTSIKLANGSSIQSPFLELICIQPN